MARSKLVMLVVALGMVGVASGCVVPPTSGGWMAAGCFDSPSVDAPDLRFSGVADAPGNLTVAMDITSFSLSSNGTCAGVPLGAPYTLTLVRADSQVAADAKCVTLGLENGSGQAQLEYPGMAADAWVCNPPEPV
jgi:hypothetical protein